MIMRKSEKKNCNIVNYGFCPKKKKKSIMDFHISEFRYNLFLFNILF